MSEPELSRSPTSPDATGRDSSTRERDEVYRRLDSILPELKTFALDFAHGTVGARPGLDAAQRELVVLGALLATGDVDVQLRAHARAAGRAGLGADQLREVVLQAVPYVGFPRAINAALALAEFLTAPD